MRPLSLGFVDAGFTNAEPFESHREFLRGQAGGIRVGREWSGWPSWRDRSENRPPGGKIDHRPAGWLLSASPSPHSLEGHFGRCYLDDDRVTKDGLALRIKSFRSFLRDNGIDSKVPFNLPAPRRSRPGGHGHVRKKLPLLCRPRGAAELLGAPHHRRCRPGVRAGRAHGEDGLSRLVPERLHRRLPHQGPQGERDHRPAEAAYPT